MYVLKVDLLSSVEDHEAVVTAHVEVCKGEYQRTDGRYELQYADKSHYGGGHLVVHEREDSGKNDDDRGRNKEEPSGSCVSVEQCNGSNKAEQDNDEADKARKCDILKICIENSDSNVKYVEAPLR